MATVLLEGKEVVVDDEGFFTNPTMWEEPMAVKLASAVDIELTEEHNAVIAFVRNDYAKTGETPTLRRISSEGGFNIKRLFQLFPKKPAKKISYIAGLPKPHGCV